MRVYPSGQAAEVEVEGQRAAGPEETVLEHVVAGHTPVTLSRRRPSTACDKPTFGVQVGSHYRGFATYSPAAAYFGMRVALLDVAFEVSIP